MHGQNNKTNIQLQYQYIFLLCIFLNAEVHKLIYIMESKINHININLFIHNLELHNNVTITIGTILCIISLSTITNLIVGGDNYGKNVNPTHIHEPSIT